MSALESRVKDRKGQGLHRLINEDPAKYSGYFQECSDWREELGKVRWLPLKQVRCL